jgi:hypothetical protein
MVKLIAGLIIIGLVYLCLAVLLFAPTIYAAWIYLMGRKVKLRKRSNFRALLTTILINLIIVYVIFHFSFGVVVPSKLAETDNLALQTMKDAIVCEHKHFNKHGRYFSVGPVRGPYNDENGVMVARDVILMIEPYWNKSPGKEGFYAYAMHVWGKSMIYADADGKLESTDRDSESVSQIKSKLLNSTK